MKTRFFKGLFGIIAVAGLCAGSAAHASTLTSVQAQAIIQLLQSFGADPSTVSAVSAALGSGYSGYSTGYAPACPALSYDLYLGLYDSQTGGQVSELQRFLGLSPTGYFGTLTESAVSNFQTQYQVYPVTGGVGPLTRAKIQQVCGGQPAPYPYPQSGALSITGVSGPNTIGVNQQGAWTVSTNAPAGTNISVGVSWGDQNLYSYAAGASTNYANQPNTFSHEYSYPGTYTILFTATDNSGHSNTASVSVVVGGSGSCTGYCGVAPTITSLSPTQGVVGTQVSIYGSGFTSDNVVHFGNGGSMNVASYDNGTLLNYTIPSTVGGCDITETLTACAQYVQQVTAGTYPVYVSNSNGQSSPVSFTVTGTNQTGLIQILSPYAGEQYASGQSVTINWSTNSNIPSGATLTLNLYASSGADIGSIAFPTFSAGSYTWQIPSFPQNYACTQQYPNGLCGTAIPTGQYYIQATVVANGFDLGASQYATAQSGVFTIVQQ